MNNMPLRNSEQKEAVVAYALWNLKSVRTNDESDIGNRGYIRKILNDKQIEIGQALTREMMQEKPTKVIARYLKTGSAAK